MTKQKVVNTTDKAVVIQPGEEVVLVGEIEKRRVLSSRTKTLRINEVEK